MTAASEVKQLIYFFHLNNEEVIMIAKTTTANKKHAHAAICFFFWFPFPMDDRFPYAWNETISKTEWRTLMSKHLLFNYKTLLYIITNAGMRSIYFSVSIIYEIIENLTGSKKKAKLFLNNRSKKGFTEFVFLSMLLAQLEDPYLTITLMTLAMITNRMKNTMKITNLRMHLALPAVEFCGTWVTCPWNKSETSIFRVNIWKIYFLNEMNKTRKFCPHITYHNWFFFSFF